MRILEEAAKFQCEETETFLRKVNASERNIHFRLFAFQTLQKQFGHTAIHLHSNRSGKMRPGDDIVPKKMDTPSLLMEEIYNSEYELEKNKKFDVFLSHSSKDYDTIIRLKTMLNSVGLTVYVDWIEDRNALKRELTNVDTARAIIERIKQSRSILYVLTETSNASVWTPWELGYAYARDKRIAVLKLVEGLKVPEYLEIYNKAIIHDGMIAITKDGLSDPVCIKEWSNRRCN